MTRPLLAVISVLALAGCGSVECPPQSSFISCGYCYEDRILSDNPHAGMCTYCSGVACGTDPCNPLCGGGGGGGGCDPSWTSRCGQTVNGIQFIGQPWPKSCGSCPAGTYYSGDDNVTAGGPYSLCTCNGF